jgi:hypothetical protein
MFESTQQFYPEKNMSSHDLAAQKTFTEQAKKALSKYLDTHELVAGWGTEKATCSIGAANIAIFGQLRKEIPLCMSLVIGNTILSIQDAMEYKDRNSVAWKETLVLAVETGRSHEDKRLAILIEWMWACLEDLQLVANAHGFGEEWAEMLRSRTEETIRAAFVARKTGGYWAERAALAAHKIAKKPNDNASSGRAADAISFASAISPGFWERHKPVELIRQLIDIGGV